MSKRDAWPTAQPTQLIVPSGWRAWLRRVTRPPNDQPGNYPVLASVADADFPNGLPSAADDGAWWAA